MNTEAIRCRNRNLKTGTARPLKLVQKWHAAWTCLGLLLLVCFCLAGCQSGSSPAARTGPGAVGYSTNNLLEGDVVNITFAYSTNFNTTQKIALDGTLNLQGVGQVKAAGKSTVELEAELTDAYKVLAKDDPITIKIVEAESAVYVSGAVTRPGKIPMERPLTVLEAIMEAGGYDAYRADLSDVLVLRVENGRQKAYRINLKRVLRGEDETPFYLQPFDVVQVATKTFNL
jgi:polysaccharide export outer membrane protein